MHVVLVDDDHLRLEATKQVLISSLAIDESDIETLSCESDFIWALDAKWATDPPQIFIIDVMLRWVDAPYPGMTPPPRTVLEEGYFRAGIRCARRARETLGNGPSIAVLTVIPKRKLTELIPLTNVHYLYKGERDYALIEWVRKAVARSNRV